VRELSLHLLDIVENSLAAGASQIKISIFEDSRKDLLQMIVEDNGRGMSPQMVSQVTDPFVTSRTTRKVGLGIPLLKLAAESCNGGLEIQSTVGKGTRLMVNFQRSHIDRMPIGDLVSTILHLVVTNPKVHWIFEYGFNGKTSTFDDQLIKQELGDVPMTEPGIINCIRQMIEATILETNPQFTPDSVTILN